jgi:hypothetical protein
VIRIHNEANFINEITTALTAIINEYVEVADQDQSEEQDEVYAVEFEGIEPEVIVMLLEWAGVSDLWLDHKLFEFFNPMTFLDDFDFEYVRKPSNSTAKKWEPWTTVWVRDANQAKASLYRFTDELMKKRIARDAKVRDQRSVSQEKSGKSVRANWYSYITGKGNSADIITLRPRDEDWRFAQLKIPHDPVFPKTRKALLLRAAEALKGKRRLTDRLKADVLRYEQYWMEIVRKTSGPAKMGKGFRFTLVQAIANEIRRRDGEPIHTFRSLCVLKYGPNG